MNVKVADFTFTNQDGEPFGLADSKDKVWVAYFTFTHCTTVRRTAANDEKCRDQGRNCILHLSRLFSKSGFIINIEPLKPKAKRRFRNITTSAIYPVGQISSWHFPFHIIRIEQKQTQQQDQRR
ncbi:SCO family protein [Paenibacillus chartarius]|uniref:SCO family protein n=1 Tax=Paenibacillus chartarius TaxID=747481 RepID=A0ABV6DMD3_9BACL